MTHAGDVASAEAFERLRGTPDTVLVDVRTAAEWTYVGLPDLSSIDKETIRISWSTYPGGIRNQVFLDQLADAGVTRDHEVFFLCRSGARSRSAAIEATGAGYTAYNVSDGFEGPLDEHGHRNTAGGWRASGLPWRQT